jgi:hypothetical protein
MGCGGLLIAAYSRLSFTPGPHTALPAPVLPSAAVVLAETRGAPRPTQTLVEFLQSGRGDDAPTFAVERLQ